MAIGTTAAILGSAAIGAVGSAVASGSNSKAIERSTDAQTQSNTQSLALQRDIYGQNRETLSPFVNRGNAAGDQINALLGLGGQQSAQPAQTTQVQPNVLSQFSGNAGLPYGIGDGFIGGASSISPANYGARGFNPAAYRDATGNQSDSLPRSNALSSIFPTLPAAQSGPLAAQSNVAQTGQTPQQAAESAFDTFRNSSGYQFRLGEGLDATNSNWFGAGLGQSGAALKALTEYGQNFASNEFSNYMGQLSQQQGTGLQAAGAQAGVGVNYANSATAINQSNANALGSAAVASANNNNALIGGITGLAGNALGALAYTPR